jgi:biotin transport system substrate-specific component
MMVRMQNSISTKAVSLQEKQLSIQAFWIMSVAFLIALGAQIEIPTQPVPFTLQTFFVLSAGAILGKRNGAISMCVYLMLGVLGLPVFSGGTFGLQKILGPTGGYLLSFPIAAFVVGFLASVRREFWWMLISMCIGSMIIFSLGTMQLNALYFHNWANSFQAGFLIFSWWDGVKIVASAAVAYSYFQRWKNQ